MKCYLHKCSFKQNICIRYILNKYFFKKENKLCLFRFLTIHNTYVLHSVWHIYTSD